MNSKLSASKGHAIEVILTRILYQGHRKNSTRVRLERPEASARAGEASVMVGTGGRPELLFQFKVFHSHTNTVLGCYSIFAGGILGAMK